MIARGGRHALSVERGAGERAAQVRLLVDADLCSAITRSPSRSTQEARLAVEIRPADGPHEMADDAARDARPRRGRARFASRSCARRAGGSVRRAAVRPTSRRGLEAGRVPRRRVPVVALHAGGVFRDYRCSSSCCGCSR